MKKRSSIKEDMLFQLFSEHSQELFLVFDQKGLVIRCNKVALNELGYEDDIYSTYIYDIFRKAVKHSKEQLNINTKYQDKVAEAVAYRKNQTCFPINLKIVNTKVGRRYLGICCAVNISTEKRAMFELRNIKNELKLSQKVKNEFVANITHELRTPVNGILGLTENLFDTELSPRQLETVNIIHRCCFNMNAIINDLLDFTKLANNKMVIEQREFDFRSFIDNMIAFNINKISEKGLKLLVNVADDIPNRVIGDELRLTQVLNNLFSNAIKFTSVGQIALEVVKTAQTDREVELFFMVMDTGIGISLEEKDKLFLSFSQVDGSISRRFGGTGLGLSISKMLIENMNGTIAVDSEKNKGSTFTFSVRLGRPNDKKEESHKGKDYYCNTKGMIRPGHELRQSQVLDTDYVGRILEKSNLVTVDSTAEYHLGQKINDLTERLTICIEMENWEKAEEIAAYLRKMLPNKEKELRNKALSLLLAIRKEEHDNSVILLNELEKCLNEVKEWEI
ncbi:hypothetical protein I5677_11905 [Mobilitalea sibirica]|uniref:Circadian input-output histidine kinase CikA n=1 Tax=Mobilitalea sibirica TaxID=1462919 RepID=A0A8J7H8R5_9FIRM|nr:ATP-binding protein [Mobilitalea sibirica]MBH1941596.1 hypothetical protein [Mobilitalea sibirica]